MGFREAGEFDIDLGISGNTNPAPTLPGPTDLADQIRDGGRVSFEGERTYLFITTSTRADNPDGSVSFCSSSLSIPFALENGAWKIADGGESAVVVGVVREDGGDPLDVVASGPVAVTSRTFNQSSSGTFGQGLGATTTAAALGAGQSALLPQLTENTAFRTNAATPTGGGKLPGGGKVRPYEDPGTREGAGWDVLPPPAITRTMHRHPASSGAIPRCARARRRPARRGGRRAASEQG